MKKKFLTGLAIGAVFFFMAGAVQADILLHEDFSSTTISDNLTISGDPLANLGKWIDFPNSNRWSIDTTYQWAQHLEQTSDNTNMLFYGVDESIATGTQLSLDFDYVTTNSNGRVVVAGLQAGSTELDPYGPWFGGGDTNDGVILWDSTLTRNSDWDIDNHYEFLATDNFDAIAVAFIMGGTTGFRAVDNIQLESAAAPVPEPATMLLFGTGIAGLVGTRLRRKKSA